jgi:hypothetical protein
MKGRMRRGGQSKTYEKLIAECARRKKINENWKDLTTDKNKWKKLINQKIPREKDLKTDTPDWTKSPELIIGCIVELKFGHKWYTGVIQDTDIDDHNGEQIWRVLFDDDDEADYNTKEMENSLCLDMDIIML